ncbi:unnamed protein product [marine sediment metagenome]|uniref:Uncharacterized protein n=1 Tax=marine sediment metagenome TaxID=412755 RepID=X1THV7_9ZZZZ
MKKEQIKKVVRDGYAKIAKQASPCCLPVNSCCGGTDLAQNISKSIGYTEEELKAVPEGANLGLGFSAAQVALRPLSPHNFAATGNVEATLCSLMSFNFRHSKIPLP